MGKWKVIRLEELARDEPGSIAIGLFGSRMKSDVYTSLGVSVIRGTNISASRAWKNSWVYVSNDFADELPNCNAREGDLVFPHRGSIGEVAFVPGDKGPAGTAPPRAQAFTAAGRCASWANNKALMSALISFRSSFTSSIRLFCLASLA